MPKSRSPTGGAAEDRHGFQEQSKALAGGGEGGGCFTGRIRGPVPRSLPPSNNRGSPGWMADSN